MNSFSVLHSKNSYASTSVFVIKGTRLGEKMVFLEHGKGQSQMDSWESARGGQRHSMPHDHAVKTRSIIIV